MEKFELETNTIWSFRDRGKWGKHNGNYPGNWTPFVPKNIISRYSRENDLILDQFLGSGTTGMEAKSLNRRFIGCDINEYAIKISKNRIENTRGNGKWKILNCDARNLKEIQDNSIDLICTHPPYSNIIKYSKDISGDISLLDEENFYVEMKLVARECFRVLKSEKYCAIMIGDMRKKGFVVPLGFNVMNIFRQTGFILKEIIIKEQHNCSSTSYWEEISKKRNFYLLAHEYIYIFYKI